ncbi:YPDG domain-containing protein [Gleimia europaea]|uniref:YPDG domain-containing protein n=2 Tax=Actinomycetaceae TaxID=2049 RepID=UPI0027D8F880|nr:YPDG domain-containing protein [Gleimia europaea]
MTPGYFLGGLDHAVAQPVAPTQVSEPSDQIIDADMIASGRVTKAANLTDAQGVGKGLISGHVYLTSPSGNPSATYANGNVKLDGITVYAQFRDKDGSYSPIFSAKTHTLPDVVAGNGGQGTFAFGTGDKGITWTDKLGTEHTWAARTDQKHRIWVEPFTNERGNQVVMFRQANGFVPGSFNGLVEGPLGSFAAADGNIQQMAAFYQEVPPNHEASWMAAKGDKLVEDPEGPISLASTQTKVPNTVSGRVWLETGGPDKGIVATGPSMNGIDEAADGYTVYASTLTKDGAAANQKLHEQYKDDPAKLAEETKKMLEDHPEYILKTVYGKTDNKGYYTLRFGNYEKGQVREDILNPNHVFVWVENKDGVVQNGYTGFHTPIFQRFNDGGNFRASAIPGENQLPIDYNGVPFQNLNSLYNVNYGIMPYTPVTITADYNATDKPAGPGTTVTPELNGDVSTLSSKVEWRDQQGNVLKTCELDQSKGMKAQVTACTFDIPADAKKGDYFNVVLVSGGNDVSAWTVLVTNDADDYTPAYEGKLVVPGVETKSSPSFTDKDGKDVTAPEGSKFAIGEDFTAPEGYEVSIDENTGEITVTFPDGSKLNKDTVEEFDVPVTVTYPDGTTDKTDANFKLDTDGDGTPDTEDEDDDNDGVPDEKEKEDDTNPKSPNQNTIYEPVYEGKLVVPGVETKSSPSFTDKDGKDVTAPEGSKFAIGEDFTAPEGYEVSIDENTGEITVTFPDGSKLNKDTVEEFDVPVTVTYPDGTTDKTDANFKLDTDGDGTPDTEDEDDDNDGVPDEKEKEDDTNPKSPNQNTIYEPVYEGKLVVPGVETKSSPSFTDKDGKDVTAPEGSKFAIGEDFTAPEGYEVSIDENTGEITVTFPDGSKLNKDTVEEFDVPVTVTYPDGTTDKTDANFKLDTDGDGTPDTEDEDDDNDGVPDEKEKEDDTNPKSPNQNTIYEPVYEGKLVVPGVETKSSPSFTDKDGKDVTAPEGSKFAIGEDFTAPEGYEVSIDENTGEITVTFPDGSKLNKDTVEEFDVPVTVTYPDGTTDKTDANFKLDTDNDGKPDTEDEDDDNDGIPDEDDSNPKVPNTNENIEPGYKDGSGKPGSDVKIDAPEFKDKDGKTTTPPEGTKFTPGEDTPDGVTIDENTGEITVTIPGDATPGDKITVPVVVTYPDGTKDNVDVTVTVEQPDAKDNEKYEPAYEGKLVVPGQETKSAPSFTDKDGKDVTAPEGSKFAIGEDFTAPEGYVVTIDENTGEITVTFPDGSKLNKDTVEEFDVPVTVTYPDGTTDKTDANFKLDTDNDGKPDTEDEDDDNDGIPDEDDSNPKVPNTNENIEPGYKDGSGKPGSDVKIDAPEFKDKDGKTTTPPEGTKFTPGEDTPDGVTIDENTGEITVTIPGDATPGDKITVPVVVTYPDGTKDNVDVTVTVEQPDQPEVKDNEKYEPEYNGGSGEPGTDVTVDKPTFKDGDGNEVTPPEGTTFTPGENVPDGVTIDENTGEITVTIPEDAKPGDKIEVPVVVTYPDGSTDEVTVTITVTEKDATPVTPGEPTERNPSLGASADDPADCEMPPFVTVEKTEGVEYKVTVDGKELTPDAEGKYVYDYGQTVKVEASPAKGFTFPEGVTTTWTYTTAQNEVCNVPETKDNEKYEPEYEDGTGKPGDDVTVDKPIFKDGDGNEVTPPEGTTFTPGEGTPDGVTVNEDGSIKVTIPEDAKPGDKITVPVVVTYPDDSTDTVEVTVTVEQPDTKTPDWKDGSGEPGGKVVIPNDGGPVDDGTTVETDGPGKAEIDGDGNLVVDIDDNAKPGDKIVVIVKDKDGNEIDRVTVTVEKPAAGDNTGETTEKVVQKPKLARTGVQVAGLAGIAAAMGVAGLGLAFMRRRREGEEN